MESHMFKAIHDNSEDNKEAGMAISSTPEDVTGRNHDTAGKGVKGSELGTKGGYGTTRLASSGHEDTTGDVNMEASMTSDDVLRAGGFGARDDIGSFLPVAIDSTDFEVSLRDARDYEEPQQEISRPGLGWTDAMESEKP